LTFFDIAKLR